MVATVSVSVLALASALNRVGWFEVPPGAGPLRRLAYGAAGEALFQLGLLGLLLAILDYLWTLGARRGRWSERAFGRGLLTLVLALLLGFGTAEAAFRLLFRNGVSCSCHAGPLVRRFERDFKFNRYDGPSRGPEVSGPKRPGTVRVLIQGDSVTWGQGVRREQDLFTNVLLRELRQEGSPVEIAVLAQPGREIDGHLAQLRRWGAEIAPDIILYQWFVNDLELDHRRRPRGFRPWRDLFFSDVLLRYSYFWFMLDDRLSARFPSCGPDYGGYLLESFEGDTAEWRSFVQVFEEWAGEARKLTPRVMVVLYPYDAGHFRLQRVHAKMIDLAERSGATGLDLYVAVPRFREEGRRLAASRFDPHPGVAAHRLIADALRDSLDRLWATALRGAEEPEIAHRAGGP